MFGTDTDNPLEPTATGNTLPFAANGLFRLPNHMVDDTPPDEPTLRPSPGLGKGVNAIFAELARLESRQRGGNSVMAATTLLARLANDLEEGVHITVGGQTKKGVEGVLGKAAPSGGILDKLKGLFPVTRVLDEPRKAYSAKITGGQNNQRHPNLPKDGDKGDPSDFSNFLLWWEDPSIDFPPHHPSPITCGSSFIFKIAGTRIRTQVLGSDPDLEDAKKLYNGAVKYYESVQWGIDGGGDENAYNDALKFRNSGADEAIAEDLKSSYGFSCEDGCKLTVEILGLAVGLSVEFYIAQETYSGGRQIYQVVKKTTIIYKAVFLVRCVTQ